MSRNQDIVKTESEKVMTIGNTIMGEVDSNSILGDVCMEEENDIFMENPVIRWLKMMIRKNNCCSRIKYRG